MLSAVFMLICEDHSSQEHTSSSVKTLIRDIEVCGVLSYAFSVPSIKRSCLLGVRRQGQPLPMGLGTDLRKRGRVTNI